MSRNEPINVWITENSIKDISGNDVILTSLAREAITKEREHANKIAIEAFVQANGDLQKFTDIITKI